ncbi:aromatic amino acid lyase [Microbacteriaceae bacterium VKM Ac-2855]|nr:aromatic amino acid lyase [Microbacteriaceae bacterium VKM Ac-2855]
MLIGGRPARPADVVAIADGAAVSLHPEAVERIAAARATVERVLAAGTPTYGLNRHLGSGRDIAVTDVAAQQNRIIDNHRGGIGDPLPEREVRALIAARLIGFAHGGSGVRVELAEEYARLLNEGVAVVVPAIGSIGASDLTQLAEVAAVARERVPLQAHEALAAVSANAYSVGVSALFADELVRFAADADLAVAVSLQALGANGRGGSLSPFDPALQRGLPTTRVPELLRGGFLEQAEAPSVQDPISFRSSPRIHGAFRRAVEALATAIEDELATPADNPLVVDGRMLSGGNFDAVALALALEGARLALATVANASERRIAHLTAQAADRRRAGRNRAPGLLSYSAAALVAELRQLASPVTLGVTSLSEGVEDHASLAPLALQAGRRALTLARQLLAIELLTAADAITAAGVHPLGEGTVTLVAALDDVLASHRAGADQVAAALRLL